MKFSNNPHSINNSCFGVACRLNADVASSGDPATRWALFPQAI